MPDMRYIHDKEKFLKYAYEVFGDCFEDETQFFEQFERIEKDKQKNLFLKISSFYKFLVRDGEFRTKVEGSIKTVDYLDQTYKFIALISFIEALYIDEEYIDFYQWLISKKRRGEIFPISDIEALKTQYSKYKSVYGAAQKAEIFFNELDEKAQDYIRSRITINGDHVSVSDLAKKL
jgi:hypothetical protein